VAHLQAAIRGLRVNRLFSILVCAVLLVGVSGGYLWYNTRRMSQDQAVARECLAVAPAAAAALFSYDYRTFDASVANGRTFAWGGFADEYAKTTASLKPAVLQEQAVVTAQASVAGVISAGGDQAEILLYVNQYRRNANITGEKVDQNRVVLTMRRIDGQWKVIGAAAI
jgi:Mce-associated membrane protein